MLFVGYFEGLDSQRGIAWRCQDSLSLREFLGLKITDNVPDHSSLTRIRDRLPIAVVQQVFAFVLKIASEKKLIAAAQVGVDSTLLEANAAMKSIVRRDSNEDWKQYIVRLMQEDGVIDEDDEPTNEQIRRFDKKRSGKKVSNDDWQSPSDDDARIVKMKDGRTHFGYKAEHAVDLDSEIVLSATVQHGTSPDSQTLIQATVDAQANLIRAGSAAEIKEVTADKGYHTNDQITHCTALGVRTYIPEPNSPYHRKWTNKPDDVQAAVLNNRRRTRQSKGKHLQRLRSERVERSFAHVCDTGGARRTWLRGVEKINKRYQLVVAAHNLGIMMRTLFGLGKPWGLGLFGQLFAFLSAILQPSRFAHWSAMLLRQLNDIASTPNPHRPQIASFIKRPICSTGC